MIDKGFVKNNKDNDIFKRSVVIVAESSEEAACLIKGKLC